MSQSKKGNQWCFGMKTHIGVDMRSGLVHTAAVTTGSVHDAKMMDDLIRADDRAVFGDKGYAGDRKKRAARQAGVYWAVKDQRKPGLQLLSRRRSATGSAALSVPRSSMCSVCSNASSDIAASAIAASPRTLCRCFRCSRSPISISHGIS
jgi:IS5 family transposase